MLNVINSLTVNNFTLFKNFQGPLNIQGQQNDFQGSRTYPVW